MQPVKGGCGCVGIMAAFTAEAKWPDVQAPQSKNHIRFAAC